MINGAILTGCAVVIYEERSLFLTGLMLFLPLLDKTWHRPRVLPDIQQLWLWFGLTVFLLIIIWLNQFQASTALTILLLTALPEEWFFRAYLLTQIERIFRDRPAPLADYKIMWLANIITSLIFALLHFPTHGWSCLMVFLPSLAFGWIFQYYRDIILVILLHTASNIFFIIYLKDSPWLKIIF